jgi:hypothetical protein
MKQGSFSSRENNAGWVVLSKEAIQYHPLHGTNAGWCLTFIIFMVIVPLAQAGNLLSLMVAAPETAQIKLVILSPMWLWSFGNAYLLSKRPHGFISSFIAWCVGIVILSFLLEGSADGIARTIGQISLLVVPGLFYIRFSKRINLNIHNRVKLDDPWYLKFKEDSEIPNANSEVDDSSPSKKSPWRENQSSKIPEEVLELTQAQVVEDSTQSPNTIELRLEMVKSLLDRDLISEDEATEKRSEILGNL